MSRLSILAVCIATIVQTCEGGSCSSSSGGDSGSNSSECPDGDCVEVCDTGRGGACFQKASCDGASDCEVSMCTSATDGTCLAGRVVDALSGEPIEGVKVTAYGECTGSECSDPYGHFSYSVTDDQGYYRIGDGTARLVMNPRDGDGSIEVSFFKTGRLGLTTFVPPDARTIGPATSFRSSAASTEYCPQVGASTIPLAESTVQDTDGDGLSDSYELRIGTDPEHTDTDGDGLYDSAEVFGSSFESLACSGASPLRKDIFLEIDYLDEDHRPSDAAIQLVVEAFANAPVDNPDGSTGISLHVEVDEALTSLAPPSADDGSGNVRTVDYGVLAGWLDLNAVRRAQFDADRENSYHYAVFTETFFKTRSNDGVDYSYDLRGSSNKSSVFVIALGAVPGDAEPDGPVSDTAQAGLIMHELGHNLQLGHGGADGENCKPNHISVMNYLYMMDGIRPTGTRHRIVDYSRYALPTLDEAALTDAQGLSQGSEEAAAYLSQWQIRVPDDVSDGWGIGCRTDLASCYYSSGDSQIDWAGDCASNVSDPDVTNDGVWAELHGSNDWAHVDLSKVHSGYVTNASAAGSEDTLEDERTSHRTNHTDTDGSSTVDDPVDEAPQAASATSLSTTVSVYCNADTNAKENQCDYL